MIRYDLICAEGHAFDAWFSDSASYDRQVDAGLVECPVCGSVDVRKQLMTPAVATGRRSAPLPDAHDASASMASQAGAVAQGGHAASPPLADAAAAHGTPDAGGDVAAQLRALARAVHEHVRRHADYVGRDFAEEARRRAAMEEVRPAWGEATREEVEELLEDGIAVLPLPPSPDEKN